MIDNMVNEDQVDGVPPGDPAASGAIVDTDADTGTNVRVVTPEFDLVARSFHDMPVNFVMEVLMTPPPMVVAKKISLFKLALLPEESKKVELGTFNEMYDAVQAWITASNVKRVEREQEYDLEDAPMLPGLSDLY